MRKTLCILYASIMCVWNSVSAAEPNWKEADRIIREIKHTEFPNNTYNILNFGAKAGSEELSTEAINKAIIACNQNGGGKVIIPPGEFLSGPVILKSNVNLCLEEGATLRFSTDSMLYIPSVLTRWEGLDCYNVSPMIYAYGENNIAITGKGTIDGQGSNEHWWPWNGNPLFGWKEGVPHQKGGSRNRLQEYSEKSVPVSGRIFGTKDALRPQLVNLNFCNRVLIEGVKLMNSPFWVIHPLFCRNLIVREVEIHSLGPNGDGCDPESCSNVLIDRCFFDTGDDCIAIKSGRNTDGRKWNIPSENIVIRNCVMKNGHGGVVIGSEIAGGYRNLYIENCRMDSPNLDRVIRIKSNPCRGGVVENIYARNISVGQCREAVLKINLDYQHDEDCDRSFPPIVRNVFLDSITCGKSKYGILIIGLKNGQNVDNINVTDCRFNNIETDYSITDAYNVTFTNLIINDRLITYKNNNINNK